MKNSNSYSRRAFLKTSGIACSATCFTSTNALESQRFSLSNQDNNLTILFQGDSITDGNRGRNEDPNHIMGHGYAFSIASRVGADFPQAGFTFYNRGISGNKVPDLIERWQQDTIALKPDLLSLLVGINDVGAIVNNEPDGWNIDAFETGYRQLLNTTKASYPNVILVLGIPFVFPVGARKTKWEVWQKETTARAEVVRKIANDYNAILVDFAAVFEEAKQKAAIEYWSWDGVHPTVFGHELMAREWIKQVSSKITCLEKYN